MDDGMYFYDTLASSGSLSLEEMIENDIRMERVSASDDDDDDGCSSLSTAPPPFEFHAGGHHHHHHNQLSNNNYHHHNHRHHYPRPSSALFDDADFRLDFDVCGGGGLLVNPCTGLPSDLDPPDHTFNGGGGGDNDDDGGSNGEFPPLVKPLVKPSQLVNNNNNNIIIKRKTPPKSSPHRKKVCDRSRSSFYSCNNDTWSGCNNMTSSDESDESSDEDYDDIDEDENDGDIDVSVNASMKRTSWVNGDGGELDARRRRTNLPAGRVKRLTEAAHNIKGGDKMDVGRPPRPRQMMAATMKSTMVAAAAAAMKTPLTEATLDEDDDEDDGKLASSATIPTIAGSDAIAGRQPQYRRIFPKPAFSYSCLIAIALKNSSTGCLPVSEIYSFMTDTFPFFKTAPSGWKNSVRHNLSLNKCFEKIENNGPVNPTSQRKGCLWALSPDKVLKMEDEVQKWSRKNPLSIKNSMARPETFELLGTGLLRPMDPVAAAEQARKVVETKAVNVIKSELDILADDDDEQNENDDCDDVGDDDDVDVDSASDSDCDSFRNPELWRELVDKMDLELPINEYLISPDRRRDVSVGLTAGVKFKPSLSPSPVLTNGNGMKGATNNNIVPAAKRLATSRERVS